MLLTYQVVVEVVVERRALKKYINMTQLPINQCSWHENIQWPISYRNDDLSTCILKSYSSLLCLTDAKF